MNSHNEDWLPTAAANCHSLADAYRAADRLESLAREHCDLTGPMPHLRKATRSALAADHTASNACLTHFAESRGWRPGKPTCTTDVLFSAAELRQRARPADVPGNVVDHAVALKAGRRVVAVLSQTYAPIAAVEQYASAHGLIHKILPASWYSRSTTAVLFTRQADQ